MWEMAARPLVGQKHKGLLKYPPHSSNALTITGNAGNSARADKRPTKEQETPSMHKKTRGLLENRNSSLAPPLPLLTVAVCTFQGRRMRKRGPSLQGPSSHETCAGTARRAFRPQRPSFFFFFFSAARRKCVLSASARENV